MYERYATFLALPDEFDDLPERVRLVLRQADAVVALAALFRAKPAFEAGLGRRVLDLSDIIPIDSPEEHTAFERARMESGLLVHALADVTVSGLSVGPSIAAALNPGIQREFMLALAVDRLEHEGCRRVVFLGDPRGVEGAAFVRRLVARGDWRIAGFGHQRAGGPLKLMPIPVEIGRPDEVARSVHSGDIVAPVRARAAGPLLDGPPPETGLVLMTEGTRTALSGVSALPVIEALKRAGTPTGAFVVAPADPAPYVELLGSERVWTLKDQVGESTIAARAEVAAGVRARVSALYRRAGGLDCWTPLETVRSERRCSAIVDRAFLAAAGAREVVRALSPRSIWASDLMSPSEQAVAAAAEEASISVLTGFAAMIADNLRCLSLVFPSAHVAVAGEYERDILTARGLSQEQLHMTGSPRFDVLWSVDRAQRRAAVRAELKIDASARVAAVLTSGLDEELETSWLVPLCREAAGRGDIVLIKPHPARLTRYERVRRSMESEGLSSVRWSSHSPTDAVCAADVLVTDKSTVAIEAVVLGRPIVQVNVTGESYGYNDFAAEGVATPATTAKEVGAAVGRLLTDEGREATFAGARSVFLRRHVHGENGRAADQVAQLLSDPPPPASGSTSPYLDVLWPPSLTDGPAIAPILNPRSSFKLDQLRSAQTLPVRQ